MSEEFIKKLNIHLIKTAKHEYRIYYDVAEKQLSIQRGLKKTVYWAEILRLNVTSFSWTLLIKKLKDLETKEDI